MTTIHSNGSKWAGEAPDTIEQLIEVLAQHPLDRRFEDYGNFIDRDPEWLDGSTKPGVVIFFGNFLTVSHVFNIETDDPEVIERLNRAIKANKRRADYRSQDKPKRRTVRK